MKCWLKTNTKQKTSRNLSGFIKFVVKKEVKEQNVCEKLLRYWKNKTGTKKH